MDDVVLADAEHTLREETRCLHQARVDVLGALARRSIPTNRARRRFSSGCVSTVANSSGSLGHQIGEFEFRAFRARPTTTTFEVRRLKGPDAARAAAGGNEQHRRPRVGEHVGVLVGRQQGVQADGMIPARMEPRRRDSRPYRAGPGDTLFCRTPSAPSIGEFSFAASSP